LATVFLTFAEVYFVYRQFPHISEKIGIYGYSAVMILSVWCQDLPNL